MRSSKTVAKTEKTPAPADWNASRRHLSKCDPVMRMVLKRVGPCKLQPQRDYFAFLCKSIYSQQISTIVAAKLFASFRELFPRGRPTPQLVKAALSGQKGVPEPRGLSRQKKAYLLDLAEHFLAGKIPSRRLSKLGDEEVIAALVGVHGIGRWTAEMFLIFVLNRPDVLPVDDLGLRIGVQKAYSLRERPTAEEVRKIAECWQPHRTLGTWSLWRYLAVKEKE
jgi:DNA-3-methyladenine glycosylase II